MRIGRNLGITCQTPKLKRVDIWQVLSKIISFDLPTTKNRYRGDNPVYQSHFNSDDKAWVISVEISGAGGRKVCHVHEDSTGTTKKGDERR